MSEGIIFQDWFDYFKYFCKDISEVCISINGLYQIVYVYDKEFYSVPYKCHNISPKNLHCAIFIHLFCDVWPFATEFDCLTAYHPKTKELLTSDGLRLLLKDERWEFFHIPEELHIVPAKLSLKELLGSYDKIISAFRDYYNHEKLYFKTCGLLTQDWIDILDENVNLDLDSQFDIDNGVIIRMNK
jgi:hypothetical protein